MKFEKVERSSYLPFYAHELWAISRSIVTLGKQLYDTELCSKYIADNNIRAFSNSSEAHEIISSILNHTSRLDKILRASNKRDNEDDDAYNFRMERCEFLKKNFLPKKKPTEIFKSSIRNGIEHFDERLDLMCGKIISQNKEINTKTLVYNLTITNTNIFDDKWDYVLPFKVFVINTGEYFMVDKNFEKQSIQIYNILNEVEKIESNCSKWFENRKDPTGKFSENPSGIIAPPLHNIH